MKMYDLLLLITMSKIGTVEKSLSLRISLPILFQMRTEMPTIVKVTMAMIVCDLIDLNIPSWSSVFNSSGSTVKICYAGIVQGCTASVL